jgi:hypothetical protein
VGNEDAMWDEGESFKEFFDFLAGITMASEPKEKFENHSYSMNRFHHDESRSLTLIIF